MSLKQALNKYLSTPRDVEWIPVSPPIDILLGGGFPRRRLIELFGPYGCGKTTICCLALASAQRMGLETVYIDMEHCFDMEYAKFHGVDPEKLKLCQPETAEEAMEIISISCDHGAGLVILDSVGGLVTKDELEGSRAAAPIARLLANELRPIIQKAKLGNTCVVFVNQLRKKVGGLIPGAEETSGGEALKYFTSMRIDVRRVGWLKTGNKVVGFKSKIKAVKNKLFPPYREGFFSVTFDPNSPDIGLVENMITTGEVKQSGSFFIYKGKKYLGKAKLAEALKGGKDV